MSGVLGCMFDGGGGSLALFKSICNTSVKVLEGMITQEGYDGTHGTFGQNV